MSLSHTTRRFVISYIFLFIFTTCCTNIYSRWTSNLLRICLFRRFRRLLIRLPLLCRLFLFRFWRFNYNFRGNISYLHLFIKHIWIFYVTFFGSVFCFTEILLSKRDLAVFCVDSAIYFGFSDCVDISGSTSENCKVSIFSSSETGFIVLQW